MLQRALSTYNSALTARPLLTKMATSGVISFFGDMLCQKIEGQFLKKKTEDGFNWHRAYVFTTIGTFYVAPVLHVHYSYVLPYLVPTVTTTGALLKLAFDQAVFAPCMLYSFYYVINFIEGRGMEQARADLKLKYWQTLKTNWQIWIPASFINFNFVPIPYQVLWANFVSLIFNTFLSFMHNSYQKDE